MTTYRGGDTVKAGFYWNRGKWGAEIVPLEGGALPGGADAVYNRIPWPGLLVAAPVMGGAFAMWDTGRSRVGADHPVAQRKADHVGPIMSAQLEHDVLAV
jgi:hypothetical protein